MFEHNHKLHLRAIVHMMPSQQNMSTIHAIEIDLAYEYEIKLKDFYLLMSKKVGDYDNIRFIKQDHKNYLHNKKQNFLRCVEASNLEIYFKRQLRENTSFYCAM